MRGKVRKIRFLIGLAILGAGTFFFQKGDKIIKAKTVISGFDKLKKELERPGKKQIQISGKVRISAPVYVKGEKVLTGKGHLIRSTSQKNGYRGSLIIVDGSSLTVKGVTISGGGKSKNLKGGVTGRLVEVKNGKFTLGEKSVLKNNINDRLAVSGGGGVLVQEDGCFVMNGGEISGNKSVMGGAGVRIEKRGLFCMTGGKIAGNQSLGAGEVEGFDGRGGAIYNEGEVKISGGVVSGNVVMGYSAGRHEYGGVGGMLYNRGMCVITGGLITGNRASSGGGAMYLDKQSYLRIMGGTIRGNRAEHGNEIYAATGTGYLSGSPLLDSIYLQTGFTLQTGSKLRIKQKILLIPEKYKKGWCIVKGGKKKDFSLAKSDNWQLGQNSHGLYMESSQNKGKVERKVRQKAGRVPVIKMSGNPLQFYEGEIIKKRALCFGLTAWDEKDGNLGKRIKVSKVVYPDGRVEKRPERLDTDKMGVGSIYYRVTNSQGRHGKLKVSYRVMKNKRAVIRVSPRYLFTWEVQRYSPEKWKEILLANCRIEDDCETEEELQKDMNIEWNGLTANKAGRYLVCISIRDQWGHRYYMKQGKAGRYGRGKVSRVQIPVTLVTENDVGSDISERYVRFFPEYGYSNGESEIWHFKRNDITQIKQYMTEQVNPFSEECNNIFLKRFWYCYKGREETQGGEK